MKIIKGDLFKLAPKKNILIPHVCNHHFVAESGFVVPLTKNFPQWKKDYKNYGKQFCQDSINTGVPLGDVVYTKCVKIHIASMIAQTLGGKRPLYYNYLVMCMEDVLEYSYKRQLDIHCPAFGSGLAGGNFDFIQCLIEDIWEKNGLEVTMYQL